MLKVKSGIIRFWILGTLVVTNWSTMTNGSQALLLQEPAFVGNVIQGSD